MRVAQILKSHKHRRCVSSNLKTIIACVTQTINHRARRERFFIRNKKLFNFSEKSVKNRVLEGQGECPKSQKKWSKTHFFPSVQKKNRTKSGQKVVFPGGRVGPSKCSTEPTFCKFFVLLIKIYSIVKMSTRYNVRTHTLCYATSSH